MQARDEEAHVFAGVLHVEVRGQVQGQACVLLIVILTHVLEGSGQQLHHTSKQAQVVTTISNPAHLLATSHKQTGTSSNNYQ